MSNSSSSQISVYVTPTVFLEFPVANHPRLASPFHESDSMSADRVAGLFLSKEAYIIEIDLVSLLLSSSFLFSDFHSSAADFITVQLARPIKVFTAHTLSQHMKHHNRTASNDVTILNRKAYNHNKYCALAKDHPLLEVLSNICAFRPKVIIKPKVLTIKDIITKEKLHTLDYQSYAA